VEIKEVRVQIPVTSTSSSKIIVPHVVQPHNNQEEQQIKVLEVNNELVIEQAQEIVLRGS